MAFSELQQRRYEKSILAWLARRRPPPEVRRELDFGYRFTNQSVEIFEIRPAWRRPGEFQEHSVVKATYVKTQKEWKVYGQRQDLKWHRYDPDPSATSIEDFLAIVDRDEYGCFFG